MNEMRDLLAYDAWATGQILEAVTTLGGAAPDSTAAAWTRDLNGAPRTSLRQQLVHLVITVDTYRACCKARSRPRSGRKSSPNPPNWLPSMTPCASA